MSIITDKEQIARYFTYLEVKEEGSATTYQTGLIVAAKKKRTRNPTPSDVVVLTYLDANDEKQPALRSIGMKFNFPQHKENFMESECAHSQTEFCDPCEKYINIVLYRLRGKLLSTDCIPYPHFSNRHVQLMTERGCLVWLSKIHVLQIHEINNVNTTSQEFMLESYKYEDEKAHFRTTSSSKSGGMGQAVLFSDYHKMETQMRGIISAFVFNESGRLAGMVVNVNRSSSVTSGINIQYHTLNFWYDMDFKIQK